MPEARVQRGPILAFAAALGAVTLWVWYASRLDSLPDAPIRATAGPSNADRAAEALVEAWASGDTAHMRLLAAPDVVHRALTDPAYRWPPDTPASDGARLQLWAARPLEAGREALTGSVRWGARRRALHITVAPAGGGLFRVDALRWR